jgi:hypothetical protein
LVAVMALTLREQFEERNGKLEDGQYEHILTLALDDQKQYIRLTDAEMAALMDPALLPPDSEDAERLAEIRERLLESMEIIADIVTRRRLHGS